jgi:hypothetical protein
MEDSLVRGLATGARVILWGSAIYHAVVGVASCFPSRLATDIGRKLYGLKIEYPLDPKYDYTLKPLGGYALFTAALCTFGLLQTDPDATAMILGSMAFLYGIRAMFRVTYFETLRAAYSITWRRNLVNVLFNTALTAWLVAATVATLAG